jgi:hypothetical protein
MEKTRFDGLTKSLAGTMDRRGFVRTVLGFGAATAVGAVGVGSVMARSVQDGTVESPICVRVCGEHSCGMPDGCGGTCMSCTGGLICLDGGVCAPLCDSDDECVGDAQCTTEASGFGICGTDERADECAASDDCPAGFFCEAESGMCRAFGGFTFAG